MKQKETQIWNHILKNPTMHKNRDQIKINPPPKKKETKHPLCKYTSCITYYSFYLNWVYIHIHYNKIH